MNSKQDLTYPRTASDLERKYNFGRSFSEIMGAVSDAQTHAYKAEEVAKKVEAKVLEINVVKELNASADVITLNSNRLVVNSDNFSLSQNGAITAKSGVLDGLTVKNAAIENCGVNGCIIQYGKIADFEISALGINKTVTTNEQVETQTIQTNNTISVTTNGVVTQYQVKELGSSSDFDLVLRNQIARMAGGYFSVEVTGIELSGNPTIMNVKRGSSSYDVQINPSTNAVEVAKSGTVDPNVYVNTTSAAKGLIFYKSTVGNVTNAIRRGSASSTRLDIDGDWYSAGNWTFSNGTTITSDVNRKHDIKNMPSEYGTLFDNLRAVVYKYNDGTSNRYHSGFIAQEVDEAITKAGLTRKDFAGLCIEDEGKESELWSLRYSEFIALNTYEIQKLKKELADIKAKIGA